MKYTNLVSLPRLRRAVGMMALTALLMLAPGCSKGESASGAPADKEMVSVVVAKAVRKDVPVEIRNFGQVDPYNTVSVKSMVAGAITEVHFQNGQKVEANQLLYLIDPRSAQAMVAQMAANLERDKAQHANAEIEARRLGELKQRGAATQDEYDQAKTAEDALAATVAADKATLDNAVVQLSYCFIRSPVAGVVGDILIDKGNVVKANDLTMVTINQIHPVYVTFTVPQQYVLEIQQQQAKHPLAVEADISGYRETGTLTFIDNTVDTATGTIRLKATFANQDEKLWPGKFVNVVLHLTELPGAIVIPAPAVVAGQTGPFVYLLGPDMTVQSRGVTTGMTVNEETVISQGLAEGDTVVTDGQYKLAPGMKVAIRAAAKTRTQPASGAAATGPAGEAR